ncbi:ClpP/crotonase [Glarea lozoyensis ATCC 20868]|uniref:ClpP/crotonase n=2 Tax=Glarea lozoyensis TaxID=101852 RepID=S3D447_GLAL2|nr:ClpP/crotonase [Glarea lozoyensis ATCC 20868]EHK97070.1 putative Carnitinyl-CoA dehydratase [Glarea lozoyensis 74030]EPE31889.1 ClpP/crotonase [Glarea lozoyensis ATCC 20868]
MTTVFTLPISTTGSITCTTPSPLVYLLTFTSPPDNRLTTSFCQTLLLALDILEFSHPPGVIVTTSSIVKFYSNGLDLEHATSTEGFFGDSLYAVFKRFLTYPMPTIALLNGHAFAGGFMLAMYHDYRVLNPSKGYLCVNELEFGVPLTAPMSSIFREKLSPQVYRKMVLEAHRWGGKEALENGIVDGLGGLEEVTKFIGEKKLTGKAKSGVYGLLKKEMYRESMGYLRDGKDEKLGGGNEEEEERRRGGEERVREWKKSNKGGAKL